MKRKQACKNGNFCSHHVQTGKLQNNNFVCFGFRYVFYVAGVIVLQESVCAVYGSGLSSACVVDIGDQKTSVCCVEDGISHRNTR